MTSEPVITWGYRPVAPPKHPRAQVGLVLGIISVLGVIVVLPALAGPLAWYYGAVARRDIEREPTRWGGRTEATAGMVCGIIGTALLALVLVVAALVVGGYALLLQTPYGT